MKVSDIGKLLFIFLKLGEATSAIDYATDAIIQNSLKETLKDATLITVAHRLQTVC
jgi:ABC-type multidrug transport system fused ATPase/permease subunit